MAGFSRLPMAAAYGDISGLAAIGCFYPPDETALDQAACGALRLLGMSLLMESRGESWQARKARIDADAEAARRACEGCIPGLWDSLGTGLTGDLFPPAIWGARRLAAWAAANAEDRAAECAMQPVGHGHETWCQQAAAIRDAAARFETEALAEIGRIRWQNTKGGSRMINRRWVAALWRMCRAVTAGGPLIFFMTPAAPRLVPPPRRT